MRGSTPTTRPLSVRVPATLYDDASDLARLSGVSLTELVKLGLEAEVTKRVYNGGDRLRATLDQMRQYRAQAEVLTPTST